MDVVNDVTGLHKIVITFGRTIFMTRCYSLNDSDIIW